MSHEPLDLVAVTARGGRLAQEIPPGSVVWITGPLGAGKTTLARALVHGRGATQAATSPTFALVHHYDGPGGAIYHVDCYRMRQPDDAADLDWQTLTSGDLLLIEWPDRAGAWAPPPDVTIAIDVVDDTRRRVGVQ